MNRLDTIIDALYKTKLLFESHGQYPLTLREVNEALAAARSLRELKPVAWVGDKPFSITRYETVAVRAGFSTPLYALEVTK